MGVKQQSAKASLVCRSMPMNTTTREATRTTREDTRTTREGTRTTREDTRTAREDTAEHEQGSCAGKKADLWNYCSD